MKLKIALMLFLVLFASTIVTTAIAFSLPTSSALTTKQIVLSHRGPRVQPIGDPIDNPFGPT